MGAGGGFSVGKSSLDTPLDGLKIWFENHCFQIYISSFKQTFVSRSHQWILLRLGNLPESYKKRLSIEDTDFKMETQSYSIPARANLLLSSASKTSGKCSLR